MVYFVRTQMLGHIVLSSTLRCHSTLRWYVFVCQQLYFKVHTHTQKNTCVVREYVKKWQSGHHQFSQVGTGRAQQLGVHALPHACRRSSGAVRVPTNNQVELRAVQSQAGEGLAGR